MSTSKSGTTESSEESHATPTEQPRPKVRRPRKDRTYKPKAPDLVQDADVRFHTYLFTILFCLILHFSHSIDH